MKSRKMFAIAALILTALVAVTYANRLHLLKYSLGWYTDFKFPRGPNIPVPWQDGPPKGGQTHS